MSNEDQSFGGWNDVPLSERGVEQARMAGHKLKRKGVRFDLAYSSVLTRASSTLTHCLDALGQPCIPTVSDWRLNERHYGRLQGMKKSEAAKLYGDEQVRIWRRGFRERPPLITPGEVHDSFGELRYAGLCRSQVPLGESLQDTRARVRQCWDELIYPELTRNRNVLLVAHGNSIRALLMEVDGISEDRIGSVEVPNGIPLVFHMRPRNGGFLRVI
ncbi:2,3-bisphosphoglycerate-dependent phosphoglycerate mutase [Burkholderia sp. R-70211]|nr:2,3-bisphosphoglycerate-dependent phosphoglycerate mutase [Burkholderia sp. R-70211]